MGGDWCQLRGSAAGLQRAMATPQVTLHTVAYTRCKIPAKRLLQEAQVAGKNIVPLVLNVPTYIVTKGDIVL